MITESLSELNLVNSFRSLNYVIFAKTKIFSLLTYKLNVILFFK